MIRDIKWMDRALCREIGPTPFHPIKGGDPDPAKRVCDSCPVKRECLDYALAEFTGTDDTGVWGGTTEMQRRAMRRPA